MYQQLILEHNKNPRNYGKISNPTHEIIKHNILCGEEIEITAIINTHITSLKFWTEGCALSKASASIMTEAIKGLSRDKANLIITDFLERYEGEGDVGELGGGCVNFASRKKCIKMAWKGMKEVLNND